MRTLINVEHFLMIIIFITSTKGVTVLYTVWRFGSRKGNKQLAKLS
ncbi:hypothetical protein AT469_06460 [Klebsiella pneumoniae]|nr:hypothetical protein AN966_25140 [Klebsiella pneumoniae]AMA18747.1 hypothetical protein AWN66_24765 [Klebsiella pneumoniae subsp. pneumoniae]ALP79760.1 hypothetical protein AC565_20425 [Klebsiella pneumoniae]ANF08534.1 hypothetical protein A7321_06680 [Klebsiella pneumoniae]ANN53653.1 hypothetical protein BAU11_19180 [Klebsiella pneumoniae]